MTAEIRTIGALRANKENDNSLLTPIDCLQDAAADIETGSRKANKAIVLLLDTTEEELYAFGYYLSNLKTSEAIALLETVKLKLASALSDN